MTVLAAIVTLDVSSAFAFSSTGLAALRLLIAILGSIFAKPFSISFATLVPSFASSGLATLAEWVNICAVRAWPLVHLLW